MIQNINNKNTISLYNNNRQKQSFKGDIGLTVAKAFIKSQENLSSTRFIQDTATNWAPKAIFARSKADFAEMSFLEFLESGIFYFASPLLGEKLFRNKVFKAVQPKNLKGAINEQIPKTVKEITNNKAITDEVKKRAISAKAGIVLACAAIPIAEYTLSFAKNLFTLKTFKKSNFNSIANLDKGKSESEDINQQQKVEKSAKKHLAIAAVGSLIGIGAGLLLAKYGHKSDKLQSVSKAILEPGKAVADSLKKVGLKSEKVGKTLSKFSLDFDGANGKLNLGKGQLALTAIVGLFGYSKAAEDRGKLDVAEVWTRVPLVVFYTIFGGELFEKGFTKILQKKNKFPDLIKKTADGALNLPKQAELPKIAEGIAKTKGTNAQKELAKLTKQKAVVTAIPYAFSLLFMGFTLSAITRLWTQFRYNHQKLNNANKQVDFITFAKNPIKTPEIFKEFEK